MRERAGGPNFGPPSLTGRKDTWLESPGRKLLKRLSTCDQGLWPDLKEEELWSRYLYDGFTTIPRTMPIIMNIIDQLSEGSKRTSITYLALWGQAFDEMYVSLQNAPELAFHAGFTGQRAVRTWRERIKVLSDLGFIRTAPGTAGTYSHAIIVNPHFVVRRLFAANTPGLTVASFNALAERAIEISAEDMGIPLPEDTVEDDKPIL